MGVQIDAVIVNCTSFNPVPSLAAAVINHFKMRSTVLAYNLAGMGCAASVIAVDLAQELLQVQSQLLESRSLICRPLALGCNDAMQLFNAMCLPEPPESCIHCK